MCPKGVDSIGKGLTTIIRDVLPIEFSLYSFIVICSIPTIMSQQQKGRVNHFWHSVFFLKIETSASKDDTLI